MDPDFGENSEPSSAVTVGQPNNPEVNETDEEVFFGPITQKEAEKIKKYGGRKTEVFSSGCLVDENTVIAHNSRKWQEADDTTESFYVDSSEDEVFFGPITSREQEKIRVHGGRRTLVWSTPYRSKLFGVDSTCNLSDSIPSIMLSPVLSTTNVSVLKETPCSSACSILPDGSPKVAIYESMCDAGVSFVTAQENFSTTCAEETKNYSQDRNEVLEMLTTSQEESVYFDAHKGKNFATVSAPMKTEGDAQLTVPPSSQEINSQFYCDMIALEISSVDPYPVVSSSSKSSLAPASSTELSNPVFSKGSSELFETVNVETFQFSTSTFNSDCGTMFPEVFVENVEDKSSPIRCQNISQAENRKEMVQNNANNSDVIVNTSAWSKDVTKSLVFDETNPSELSKITDVDVCTSDVHNEDNLNFRLSYPLKRSAADLTFSPQNTISIDIMNSSTPDNYSGTSYNPKSELETNVTSPLKDSIISTSSSVDTFATIGVNSSGYIPESSSPSTGNSSLNSGNEASGRGYFASVSSEDMETVIIVSTSKETAKSDAIDDNHALNSSFTNTGRSSLTCENKDSGEGYIVDDCSQDSKTETAVMYCKQMKLLPCEECSSDQTCNDSATNSGISSLMYEEKARSEDNVEGCNAGSISEDKEIETVVSSAKDSNFFPSVAHHDLKCSFTHSQKSSLIYENRVSTDDCIEGHDGGNPSLARELEENVTSKALNLFPYEEYDFNYSSNGLYTITQKSSLMPENKTNSEGNNEGQDAVTPSEDMEKESLLLSSKELKMSPSKEYNDDASNGSFTNGDKSTFMYENNASIKDYIEGADASDSSDNRETDTMASSSKDLKLSPSKESDVDRVSRSSSIQKPSMMCESKTAEDNTGRAGCHDTASPSEEKETESMMSSSKELKLFLAEVPDADHASSCSSGNAGKSSLIFDYNTSEEFTEDAGEPLQDKETDTNMSSSEELKLSPSKEYDGDHASFGSSTFSQIPSISTEGKDAESLLQEKETKSAMTPLKEFKLSPTKEYDGDHASFGSSIVSEIPPISSKDYTEDANELLQDKETDTNMSSSEELKLSPLKEYDGDHASSGSSTVSRIPSITTEGQDAASLSEEKEMKSTLTPLKELKLSPLKDYDGDHASFGSSTVSQIPSLSTEDNTESQDAASLLEEKETKSAMTPLKEFKLSPTKEYDGDHASFGSSIVSQIPPISSKDYTEDANELLQNKETDTNMSSSEELKLSPSKEYEGDHASFGSFTVSRIPAISTEDNTEGQDAASLSEEKETKSTMTPLKELKLSPLKDYNGDHASFGSSTVSQIPSLSTEDNTEGQDAARLSEEKETNSTVTPFKELKLSLSKEYDGDHASFGSFTVSRIPSISTEDNTEGQDATSLSEKETKSTMTPFKELKLSPSKEYDGDHSSIGSSTNTGKSFVMYDNVAENEINFKDLDPGSPSEDKDTEITVSSSRKFPSVQNDSNPSFNTSSTLIRKSSMIYGNKASSEDCIEDHEPTSTSEGIETDIVVSSSKELNVSPSKEYKPDQASSTSSTNTHKSSFTYANKASSEDHIEDHAPDSSSQDKETEEIASSSKELTLSPSKECKPDQVSSTSSTNSNKSSLTYANKANSEDYIEDHAPDSTSQDKDMEEIVSVSKELTLSPSKEYKPGQVSNTSPTNIHKLSFTYAKKAGNEDYMEGHTPDSTSQGKEKKEIVPASELNVSPSKEYKPDQASSTSSTLIHNLSFTHENKASREDYTEDYVPDSTSQDKDTEVMVLSSKDLNVSPSKEYKPDQASRTSSTNIHKLSFTYENSGSREDYIESQNADNLSEGKETEAMLSSSMDSSIFQSEEYHAKHASSGSSDNVGRSSFMHEENTEGYDASGPSEDKETETIKPSSKTLNSFPSKECESAQASNGASSNGQKLPLTYENSVNGVDNIEDCDASSPSEDTEIATIVPLSKVFAFLPSNESDIFETFRSTATSTPRSSNKKSSRSLCTNTQTIESTAITHSEPSCSHMPKLNPNETEVSMIEDVTMNDLFDEVDNASICFESRLVDFSEVQNLSFFSKRLSSLLSDLSSGYPDASSASKTDNKTGSYCLRRSSLFSSLISNAERSDHLSSVSQRFPSIFSMCEEDTLNSTQKSGVLETTEVSPSNQVNDCEVGQLIQKEEVTQTQPSFSYQDENNTDKSVLTFLYPDVPGEKIDAHMDEYISSTCSSDVLSQEDRHDAETNAGSSDSWTTVPSFNESNIEPGQNFSASHNTDQTDAKHFDISKQTAEDSTESNTLECHKDTSAAFKDPLKSRSITSHSSNNIYNTSDLPLPAKKTGDVVENTNDNVQKGISTTCMNTEQLVPRGFNDEPKENLTPLKSRLSFHKTIGKTTSHVQYVQEKNSGNRKKIQDKQPAQKPARRQIVKPKNWHGSANAQSNKINVGSPLKAMTSVTKMPPPRIPLSLGSKRLNVTSPVAQYVRDHPAPPLIRNVRQKSHVANTHEMSVLMGKNSESILLRMDSRLPRRAESVASEKHQIPRVDSPLLPPARYALRRTVASRLHNGGLSKTRSEEANLRNVPSPRVLKHRGANKTLQWANDLESASPDLLSSPSRVPTEARKSILVKNLSSTEKNASGAAFSRRTTLESSVVEEVYVKTTHTLEKKTRF